MRAKAEIYAPDLNRSGVLAKYQVLHFFVCRFRRGFGEGDSVIDLRRNFAVEICELLGGKSAFEQTFARCIQRVFFFHLFEFACRPVFGRV